MHISVQICILRSRLYSQVQASTMSRMLILTSSFPTKNETSMVVKRMQLEELRCTMAQVMDQQIGLYKKVNMITL